MAKNKCHVRVLTTDSNGLEQELDVEKTHEVKLADFLSVRYCRRLTQESVSLPLLKLLPSYISWADVVHLTAVYSFPTMPALFLSKILKKPVVWSPHGALQRWQGTRKKNLKALWEKICHLVSPEDLILHATSEEEAKASQNRLPGIRTVIIPNGVEVPQKVNPVPTNGVLRLGFLGRLNSIKGLENLLAACAKLKAKKDFPFLLTVGGSGSPFYTQSLEKEIEKFGLPSHVNMVGHIEAHKKPQFFENLDILVLPSHTENFGLVVAEALAHSVPVIASRGTPWERVEAVGCGLWVDNNPGSLADAIIHMNQMPLLEMGKRGHKWMEQEYSWSQVATQMKRLYEELAMKAS